jgi:YidC/Oxa1 family membrane protein insertase
MNPWLVFVEAVRLALFAAAHLLGGSIGAGILTFSLVVRIAALPITIPAARRMREQNARLRRLKPELEQLAKTYRKDPRALLDAKAVLFREHGISTKPDLKTMLFQWPVGAGVFSALRSGVARNTQFLWIRDLTRPDVGIALIAAGIAAMAARLSGTDNPRVAITIATAVTFFFAWRMSASIGLYSIAWSGVSAVESLALVINERRKPA